MKNEMKEYLEEAVNDEVFHHDPEVVIEQVYVCGFAFQKVGERNHNVALIRKTRPSWQAGKLNGIGGKVEKDESPRAAMTREFREETGAVITDWRPFAVLKHGKGLIYMFTAMVGMSVRLEQTTDEEPGWIGVGYLPFTKHVSNLDWLIPLALSGNAEVAVIQDETPFEKAA